MEASRESATRALLAVAGPESFRRFIEALDSYRSEPSPRLRYWQESLWEKAQVTGQFAVNDFRAICDLLLVCYVHEQPLEWRETHAVVGLPQHTDDYLAAEPELFPHSHEVEFSANQARKGGSGRVLSCSGCIAARREWSGQWSNNSFKPKPLRGSA